MPGSVTEATKRPSSLASGYSLVKARRASKRRGGDDGPQLRDGLCRQHVRRIVNAKRSGVSRARERSGPEDERGSQEQNAGAQKGFHRRGQRGTPAKSASGRQYRQSDRARAPVR